MKALVALILLVQLPIHKAVPAAAPAPLGCDDPESEAAAEAAVSYINAHSRHGYKFALNRIENIRVLPQEPRKVGIQCTRPFRTSSCLKTLKRVPDVNKNENPWLFSTYYEKEDTKGLNNDIVFLELDLLETTCHILSPTPLANCTVRSFTDHAVEGDCDVKLQKVDGKFSVLASKCHSHPDSREDVLQVCPDCPLLESLNDTEVSTLVTSALKDHNSKTPNAYLRLLEIGRAKIQYEPVHVVIAEFAVAATNCSAQDAKTNAEACHLLPDDEANFGFCTATMVKQPSQDLEVDCQLYGHQPGVTYSQPGQDTSAGLAPSVVQGFTNHNLKFSHNNPVASESSSSEFPTAVLSAKPVAKRAVAEVAQHDKVPRPVGFVPPPPPCPGRIRYFKI